MFLFYQVAETVFVAELISAVAAGFAANENLIAAGGISISTASVAVDIPGCHSAGEP